MKRRAPMRSPRSGSLSMLSAAHGASCRRGLRSRPSNGEFGNIQPLVGITGDAGHRSCDGGPSTWVSAHAGNQGVCGAAGCTPWTSQRVLEKIRRDRSVITASVSRYRQWQRPTAVLTMDPHVVPISERGFLPPQRHSLDLPFSSHGGPTAPWHGWDPLVTKPALLRRTGALFAPPRTAKARASGWPGGGTGPPISSTPSINPLRAGTLRAIGPNGGLHPQARPIPARWIYGDSELDF